MLEVVFPSPRLPSAAAQLEERQSSCLLRGTAEKSCSTGQVLPHQAAASAHLALGGARINAKTNPDSEAVSLSPLDGN